KAEICAHVDHAVDRVRNIVTARVRNARHELRHLASADRLGAFPRRVAEKRERLSRGSVTLYRMLDTRAKSLRRRLAACDEPLARIPSRVDRARHRLESIVAHLEAVSPLSVLSRGYAIAFSR